MIGKASYDKPDSVMVLTVSSAMLVRSSSARWEVMVEFSLLNTPLSMAFSCREAGLREAEGHQ